jgi:hypothetical protein
MLPALHHHQCAVSGADVCTVYRIFRVGECSSVLTDGIGACIPLLARCSELLYYTRRGVRCFVQAAEYIRKYAQPQQLPDLQKRAVGSGGLNAESDSEALDKELARLLAIRQQREIAKACDAPPPPPHPIVRITDSFIRT